MSRFQLLIAQKDEVKKEALLLIDSGLLVSAEKWLQLDLTILQLLLNIDFYPTIQLFEPLSQFFQWIKDYFGDRE